MKLMKSLRSSKVRRESSWHKGMTHHILRTCFTMTQNLANEKHWLRTGIRSLASSSLQTWMTLQCARCWLGKICAPLSWTSTKTPSADNPTSQRSLADQRGRLGRARGAKAGLARWLSGSQDSFAVSQGASLQHWKKVFYPVARREECPNSDICTKSQSIWPELY